jgi:hypothetical protein
MWREPPDWNALACSQSKWSFSMTTPFQHSTVTMLILQQFCCGYLVHTPFRLDLASSDFHLIWSLEMHFEEITYDTMARCRPMCTGRWYLLRDNWMRGISHRKVSQSLWQLLEEINCLLFIVHLDVFIETLKTSVAQLRKLHSEHLSYEYKFTLCWHWYISLYNSCKDESSGI